MEGSMDIAQAMNNILKVVRAFKGTADEHEILKMSMDRIAELVSKGLQAEKAEKENKQQ